MFSSQACRVTWNRFHAHANLLIWTGRREQEMQCSLWGEDSGSWIQQNHSVSALKSETVIRVIISSDILFTRASSHNGLMRMKRLRQGFQAGMPGRMWRGSICITSYQHELCQTQLFCWELTQGLRQQHRDRSAAAAQMEMKTIPATGSTWTSPVHPGTFQKVPWVFICTAFNTVKWEIKEVSLCLQHQLQNCLETLGKAGYLR